MPEPMSGPHVAAGRDRTSLAAVGGLMATWGGFWSLLIWDTGGKTPILWCVVPRDRQFVDPRMTWLERWLR